jgi:hypothetical protein
MDILDELDAKYSKPVGGSVVQPPTGMAQSAEPVAVDILDDLDKKYSNPPSIKAPAKSEPGLTPSMSDGMAAAGKAFAGVEPIKATTPEAKANWGKFTDATTKLINYEMDRVGGIGGIPEQLKPEWLRRADVASMKQLVPFDMYKGREDVTPADTLGEKAIEVLAGGAGFAGSLAGVGSLKLATKIPGVVKAIAGLKNFPILQKVVAAGINNAVTFSARGQAYQDPFTPAIDRIKQVPGEMLMGAAFGALPALEKLDRAGKVLEWPVVAGLGYYGDFGMDKNMMPEDRMLNMVGLLVLHGGGKVGQWSKGRDVAKQQLKQMYGERVQQGLSDKINQDKIDAIVDRVGFAMEDAPKPPVLPRPYTDLTPTPAEQLKMGGVKVEGVSRPPPLPVQPEVAKQDNPLQKASGEYNKDMQEIQSVVDEVSPGAKVSSAHPQGGDIGVSPDGTQIRIQSSFLRKVKEKYPSNWKDAVRLAINEELIHQRHIADRGGKNKAATRFAEEWNSATMEEQKAVRDAYGDSSKMSESELGAELARMKEQVLSSGRITESIHPTRGNAARKVVDIFRKPAEPSRPVSPPERVEEVPAERSTRPGSDSPRYQQVWDRAFDAAKSGRPDAGNNLRGMMYEVYNEGYREGLRNKPEPSMAVEEVAPRVGAEQVTPTSTPQVEAMAGKKPPELMTADEFVKEFWLHGRGFTHPRFSQSNTIGGITKSANEAMAFARIRTDTGLSNISSQGEISLIRDRDIPSIFRDEIGTRKSYSPSRSVTWKVEQSIPGDTENPHEYLVRKGIQDKLPVSASAVDAYGIKLPEGYIRQGDQYVYKPAGVPAVVEKPTTTTVTGRTDATVAKPAEPTISPVTPKAELVGKPAKPLVAQMEKLKKAKVVTSPAGEGVIGKTTISNDSSNAGGTITWEYRTRIISNDELIAWQKRAGLAPSGSRKPMWIVESRRIDKPKNKGTIIETEWEQTYEPSLTRQEAVSRALSGGSRMREMKSSDPDVAAHWAKDKAVEGAVRAEFNAGSEIDGIKADSKSELATALKKAKLYQLAMEGKAPEDKVNAIKTELMKKWKPIADASISKQKKLRSELTRLRTAPLSEFQPTPPKTETTTEGKIEEPITKTVTGKGMETVVGPGAATLVSAYDPEGIGGTFSIRHADIVRSRLQRGYPGIEKFPVGDEKVFSSAMSMLDKNPHAGIDLITELTAKPRPTSAEEVVLLRNEAAIAEDMVNEANSADLVLTQRGDTQGKKANAVIMEAANRRLDDIQRAIYESHSESGRAFRTIQLAIDENMNFVRMMSRRRIVNDGKTTPDQDAETKEISNEYRDILVDLNKRMVALGEGAYKDSEVQRLRKMLESVRKRWVDAIDRDKVNGDRWVEAMQAFVEKRKAKVPASVLTEVESELRNAAKIPDVAKRDSAIMDAINKLDQHIPLKRGEWFDAYVYFNMLSGVTTHERNIFGNFANAVLWRPLTLTLRGDISGARRFASAAWKSILDGSALKTAVQAFQSGQESKVMEGLKALTEGATSSEQKAHTFEEAKRLQGPKAILPRVAWKVLTSVGKFLHAQDMYFDTVIRAGERNRLVKEGVAPEIAEARAEKLAREYLYRDTMSGEPDKSLDVFSRSIEQFGHGVDWFRLPERTAAIRYPAKLTVPFLKTITKIAQFNMQFTTVAFIGARKNAIAKAHYGESFDDMKLKLLNEKSKATPDADEISKLDKQMSEVEYTHAERMGKAAVGTMAFVLGSAMAATGNTIWAAPKDERARKLFYDAGYKPYSFRVGNTWIPMVYLGPAMLSFALPAAWKDTWFDNPDKAYAPMPEKIWHLAMTLPQMVASQLPMQGIESLMNTLTGREDYTWKRYAGQTMLQMTPASGLLRWINNFVDPSYRRPVSIGDTVRAGIPGLSNGLKAIQDSNGMNAKKSLLDALLPWKVGRTNFEKESLYKQDLYNRRESGAFKQVNQRIESSKTPKPITSLSILKSHQERMKRLSKPQ